MPDADLTALADDLVQHYAHGYACGDECDYVLNSPRGWAEHVAEHLLAAGWHR